MMVATAMAAAFQRAGIDPIEAAFKVDLARYLNNGLSLARVIEIAREIAEEMLDEGLSHVAGNGHPTDADVRHLNGGGEGHDAGVASGDHTSYAPPPPPGGEGVGHQARASNGRFASARPSLPGREMTSLDCVAMIAARRSAAAAIMEIDGVDIRDLTIGQLISGARRKGIEHRVMAELGRMFEHLPHTTVLRVVVSDRTILDVVRQAKERVHAA